MSWIEHGPVSLPPQRVVTFAAAAIVATALLAGGLGFRSGWRDGSRSAAAGEDATDVSAQAITAKPLVELPPPIIPPAASNAAPPSNAMAANGQGDGDIDAKQAQAQAVQAKPSQSAGDIDDILTSQSEKPQAPVKPPADESAPPAPGKSDVPF
jgi:hypothetical protein